MYKPAKKERNSKTLEWRRNSGKH